ncbi:MAG: FHA domain-containing protein [Deltaproteobacteria bacterium]|nr:FHA domain-containing protein [Deltaproteobacteria bacterium]
MYLLATDDKGTSRGAIEVTAEAQTIGRSINCALVIDGLGVSRIHATVYLYEARVVIKDEGSANGVEVNGSKITGPTLVEGAHTIKISGFRLRVQSGPPTVAAPERTEFAEDADTHLEASQASAEGGASAAVSAVGAASKGAGAVLLLVGRGGPYDGTTLRVTQALSTVGRDDDNEVVLEDPSISRQHAQLRWSSETDQLTVLDLRSSNGTFLDGKRIKRAEVPVGAILRFGDLAFKVVKEEGRVEVGRQRSVSPRKRLWIALGGGAVLMTALVVVAVVKTPRKPPPPRPITPEELLRKRQAELQGVVDTARRDMVKREWSAAIVKLDEVLKKDPLNQKAKVWRSQALDELGHSKTFETGQRFFALGNRENLVKAQRFFLRVPGSSVYAREIKYKLRTINERIAEEYRIDGVSRCKARYYRRCYRSLCKYFQVMPKDVSVPGEPGLRRRMAFVEKRYGRSKRFKRCAAPRYLRQDAMQRSEDPQEVLREKYLVLSIRATVTLYYQGKIDVAIKEMAKLRSRRRMRPHMRRLEEINRQMLIVRGKYQEAFSFIRQRKVQEADREVTQLLAADSVLIPKRLTSFYQRDVKVALGKLYAELGSEAFKVKRYADAFNNWRRSVQVYPASEAALNGLLRLEKAAEELIIEGRSMAAGGKLGRARLKLTMARDICREGKPQRKEATAALTELGK